MVFPVSQGTWDASRYKPANLWHLAELLEWDFSSINKATGGWDNKGPLWLGTPYDKLPWELSQLDEVLLVISCLRTLVSLATKVHPAKCTLRMVIKSSSQDTEQDDREKPHVVFYVGNPPQSWSKWTPV